MMNREKIYDEFLEVWSIDRIKKMSLNEYVNINNKDTFCQWLETRTRCLGSIKGGDSIKFGIYKRQENRNTRSKFKNDHTHTWLSRLGKTKKQAFENLKKELIELVDAAQKQQFEIVERSQLSSMFKWKIAFLYSNKRLIPIYSPETLHKIGNYYGLDMNSKAVKISEIQELMISNKPNHLTVFEFASELYQKFRFQLNNEPKSNRKKSNLRNSVESKNTQPQNRKAPLSYVAQQLHNQMQQALYEKLVKKYKNSSVCMENNNVDIKVTHKSIIDFYEVKSSSYASDCIKQALGQILAYVHHDGDKRKKRLFIVGPNELNEAEKPFFDFIKKSLAFDFQYISFPLN